MRGRVQSRIVHGPGAFRIPHGAARRMSQRCGPSFREEPQTPTVSRGRSPGAESSTKCSDVVPQAASPPRLRPVLVPSTAGLGSLWPPCLGATPSRTFSLADILALSMAGASSATRAARPRRSRLNQRARSRAQRTAFLLPVGTPATATNKGDCDLPSKKYGGQNGRNGDGARPRGS